MLVAFWITTVLLSIRCAGFVAARVRSQGEQGEAGFLKDNPC